MAKRRKRDKNRVDRAKLSPRVAEGITEGPDSLAEADEKFPKMPGALDLSYMLKETDGPKFVARNAREPVGAFNFGDERWFRDTDVIFTREDRLKIERGYMCLRCYEPQSSFNADDHLPGCYGVDQFGPHYMRDGHMQIEVAAEFAGVEHLGPRRPLSEHIKRQDDRNKKLAWIREQVNKGNMEAARRAYGELVADAKTNAH